MFRIFSMPRSLVKKAATSSSRSSGISSSSNTILLAKNTGNRQYRPYNFIPGNREVAARTISTYQQPNNANATVVSSHRYSAIVRRYSSNHRTNHNNNKSKLQQATTSNLNTIQKRTIMSTQIMRAYASQLTRKVVDLIQTRGPLTVADYMKIVLTNPDNGFYMDRDVFGAKGHFTTNPEISQIFGELCGVWILNEWQRFKCPKPLRIVELGPGRGTLMSDIERTLYQFGKSREVSSLHLVEVSPFLTQVQEQTLCGTTSLIGRNENNRIGANHNSLTKNGLPVTWYRSLDHLEPLPSGFTAFVAHEFFDALPIHKFVRDPTNRAWRELLVDYDKNHDLRFAISKEPTIASRLLTQSHIDSDIEHLEVCPEAALHVEKIMKRLNTKNSGCMLMCDYGFEDDSDLDKLNSSQGKDMTKLRSNRDTFRGFKAHNHWPPLKEPGTADLTADVDFGYLKEQVQNQATIFGPVTQADFLLKCGVGLRLESLMRNASEDEKRNLSSGVDMMINDMGQRYKFMSLFPKGAESLFKNNPPAGFDE